MERIENIVKRRDKIEELLTIKKRYQKRGTWRNCYAEKGAISSIIKTDLFYIAKYECCANIINTYFKKWYSRKILEENTNLPTDVINYCIFPYLFKETQILI